MGQVVFTFWSGLRPVSVSFSFPEAVTNAEWPATCADGSGLHHQGLDVPKLQEVARSGAIQRSPSVDVFIVTYPGLAMDHFGIELGEYEVL